MARSVQTTEPPPLIVHVIYRLAVGGLENGLVNMINAMPAQRYRHAIVCLTDHTDFRDRIHRSDVEIIALYKKEGYSLEIYRRMWKVLRSLRPAIVHTRNLPTMEFSWIAALAGVRARVHSEHGRDMYDLHGANTKYNILRRAMRPVIGHYIAVSQDLEQWLRGCVGVQRDRLTQIYNGVDSRRFHPRAGGRSIVAPAGFFSEGIVGIGTVGRMQSVKDQLTLTKAFVRLLQEEPAWKCTARLVLVGDGPLRQTCLNVLEQAGVRDLAWVPGEREDVPEILRTLDIFVLPSLGEGISNTILEAMATGLPVIATDVGGNSELVVHGQTGVLVPSADPWRMAQALRAYLADPDLRDTHGRAGRRMVEERFGIDAMVQGYLRVYDGLLTRSNRIGMPADSFRMGEA
jgi:sugar transferase (PEP-CTERM/EpsH1 system associated)